MSRIGQFRLRSLTVARGALVTAVALPVLLAGTPAYAADDGGLYGSQDPGFDGTFRQSLAILALQSAGEPVPPRAIEWLADQQCADGGWAPYRADTTTKCAAKKEDSNSTALAVQALAGVGGFSAEVDQGLGWLRDQQNEDGGVGYDPGGATDANSTALFVQALAAAEVDPTGETVAENSPVDALLDLQLGCDAPRRTRGAFAYQAAKGGGEEPAANDIATVAALFALSGQVHPVTEPGSGEPQPLSCGSAVADPEVPDAAAAAADYLGGVLASNSDTVPALQGDGPDLGTTASAVVALSAFGAADESEQAMAALTKKASRYAKGPDGEDAPASLANLVLAASAAGTDPTDVAGDAVTRLAETGPEAPQTTVAPKKRATEERETTPATSGSWTAAVVIGAVVALGVLVLLRRRGEQGDQ
ncbi:MAG: hypothetical protein GEV07_22305 [Streptosporangiales bacterium]|nr:hypothetical protein [Streptosporangiales bacterium]